MLGILSLLALWYAVIIGFQVRRFIAPDPLSVAKSIWTNRQLLWANLRVTASEAVLGFLVGNIIGILLATVPMNSNSM